MHVDWGDGAPKKEADRDPGRDPLEHSAGHPPPCSTRQGSSLKAEALVGGRAWQRHAQTWASGQPLRRRRHVRVPGARCVCVCVRARAGGCVGVGPVGGRCLARAHIHPSIHLACSHSLLLPVALYVGTHICTDSAGAPLFLCSIPSHARRPANVTRTRPRDGERVRDGWNTYRTVCPPCKCTL